MAMVHRYGRSITQTRDFRRTVRSRPTALSVRVPEILESRLVLSSFGVANLVTDAQGTLSPCEITLARPQPTGEDELSAIPVDGTVVLDAAIPSAASAPSLDTSFDGLNFNQEASKSGYYHTPPDPIGAAGPTQVVSVVNTTIQWYTKSGVQQHSQGLASFFSALSPQAARIFDPKVIYDSHADRFVVVALEHEATSLGDAANASRILVAVSNTSDPNAGWNVQAVSSKLTITGSDTWADYPGLAVDSQAVYITTNQFAFSNGAIKGERLWIVDKNPLFSGGAIAATAYNAFAAAGFSQFSISDADSDLRFGRCRRFGRHVCGQLGLVQRQYRLLERDPRRQSAGKPLLHQSIH